jgi:hypothetical protein
VLLDDLFKVFNRFFQPASSPRPPQPVIIMTNEQDVLLDEKILADLRSLNQPDMPDFLNQLISLFLQDSNILMETVRSSADAGEWDTLRKAVHSLKGISSNLGAARLSKTCGQVEACLRNSLPLAEGWQASLEKEYVLACDALKHVPS